jgi:hypothetical protein
LGAKGSKCFFGSFKIRLILRLNSPIIEAAWTGRLLHLAGLNVIGATAGSLARLVQDRETELWEGKQIVSNASTEEVTLNLL